MKVAGFTSLYLERLSGVLSFCKPLQSYWVDFVDVGFHSPQFLTRDPWNSHLKQIYTHYNLWVCMFENVVIKWKVKDFLSLSLSLFTCFGTHYCLDYQRDTESVERERERVWKWQSGREWGVSKTLGKVKTVSFDVECNMGRSGVILG